MEVKDALSRVEAICSKKEMCSGDVVEKLRKWEVDEDSWDSIVDSLIDNRYLDNRRYASLYVRSKYIYNRWGKIKIRYNLKQKGVDSSHIQAAIDEINEEEYRQNLIHLIENKMHSLRKESDNYKKRAAVVRFCQGRGFENDLIFNLLDFDD